MTDPVGVAQDPRKVLMIGDEPDTVAELMALIDTYATQAVMTGVHAARGQGEPKALGELLAPVRMAVERAIRAALEAQP